MREVGDRLALRLWQQVAERRRWHRKGVAIHSPLRALHRLYGPEAPLVAVGLPPDGWPSSVNVATADSVRGRPHVTAGQLVVGRQGYPFRLRWEELSASGPALLELLPGVHPGDGDLPTPAVLGRAVADRLFGPAPVPAGLDAVGSALWTVERAVGGLPLVVRCLAAWWRAAPAVGADGDAPALAAAVASLVGNRSGLRRSRAAAAADHGTDPHVVAATAGLLQRHLQLSSERPW